jgi:hypothetical protein
MLVHQLWISEILIHSPNIMTWILVVFFSNPSYIPGYYNQLDHEHIFLLPSNFIIHQLTCNVMMMNCAVEIILKYTEK